MAASTSPSDTEPRVGDTSVAVQRFLRRFEAGLVVVGVTFVGVFLGFILRDAVTALLTTATQSLVTSLLGFWLYVSLVAAVVLVVCAIGTLALAVLPYLDAIVTETE